jgi:hypothetical protein
VEDRIAAPYYDDFVLGYFDEEIALAPDPNLGLEIAVEEMVAEAVAASHQYDYWTGFWEWVQGEPPELSMDIPLEASFDETAAEGFLAGVAEDYDLAPTEPMVDVDTLTFLPGRPGYHLEIQPAADLINQKVMDPEQRTATLPIRTDQPDQSPARVESMLSTLGPVMQRAPTAPRFFTATLPISTTGGLAGTPLVTYTGELTWTFPHFISYTGYLTSTYTYLFEEGEPGYRFDVKEATDRVIQALQSGSTEPITFEADLVPPPPITPALLLPPLEARLAEFPGVVSLLVENLDTGEVIYESGVDHVLSGMSLVKIGIMVEVYRRYGGSVDAETLEELYNMLGSESCNPCANRLLAAIGDGNARTGAQNVTATMRRLGLDNFYLCAPFRVVDNWDPGPVMGSTDHGTLWLAQAKTPRYDPCVKATPREMANLMEMVYNCTNDQGLLRDAYPNIFAPRVCSEMIDIMAANDLRNMLGAGIPAEVRMAHKHGFAGYDVPWGDTRAEVGIVFSPGATWLVSFYIWDDTPWLDYSIVQPLYRDVSVMLYNYFNPDQPYWPRPPWTPSPEEISGDGET